MVELVNNKHSSWPTSGAILWVSQTAATSPLQTQIETSEIYRYAQALLCQGSPRSQALLNAHSHPDLFILKPVEDSRWIKIDQVRELIEWSTGRAQIASRKIAIIVPAEALNLQAANALLKTLEESSEDTLFILITARPSALPTTVISRCHLLREQTSRGLQVSTSENSNKENNDNKKKDNLVYQQVLNGLKALSSEKTDPVTLAAEWVKQDLNAVLNSLIEILSDAIVTLAKKKKTAELHQTFNFLDQVYQSKRVFLEHVSVNTQLLMESLLIKFFIPLEN